MWAASTAESHEPEAEPESGQCLTVILATGGSDGGTRAVLAFLAACCWAARNQRTQVFLVGDGAHWGFQGSATAVRRRGLPPLAELIDCLIDLGGEIYACSTCDRLCSEPEQTLSAEARRAWLACVRPRSLSSILGDLAGGGVLTF